MDEFWQGFWVFADNHPFIAWCMAWGVWVIRPIFEMPFRIYNRHLRAGNIRSQGWPTAHLMDADGDIVHPPKEDKEPTT